MSDTSASAAASRFALLLDTNAFIALEPTSPSFQADLPDAADLVRLAQQGDHKFYLSAGTAHDINRDPQADRRRANHALAGKYCVVPLQLRGRARGRGMGAWVGRAGVCCGRSGWVAQEPPHAGWIADRQSG